MNVYLLESPHLSHLRTVVTLRFTVMQEVGPGPYHQTYYPHPTGLTTVDISRSNKCISIFELTLPYERNISNDHNYKCHKYAHLTIDLNNCGFKVSFFAVEIGCRRLFSENNSKRLHVFYHSSQVLNSMHQILDILKKHFVKQ